MQPRTAQSTLGQAALASISASERVLALLVAWEEQHAQGRNLSAEELCADEPELLECLRAALRRRLLLQGLLEPPTPSQGQGPAPVPDIPGYELLEVIGHGGMGVVYKARHRDLHRLVAVKMILRGASASAEERARFRTEAEAVARVHHANIVQIYEVGQCDGHPYLVLEYVEGGSLALRLDGTPWPARPAADLVHTLALAIQHAHERLILHRDLKPGNVLLVSGGLVSGGLVAGQGLHQAPETKPPDTRHQSPVPKITDFGLAKRLDLDQGHTHTGMVLGSPSYMAPEQAEGDGRAVGPPADIYALGAILYELLTGRPPFRGATALETLYQLRHEEPVRARHLQPGLPRDLEVITLKCLEKEPARRYRSAAALAEDLRRFLAHEPIRARPLGAVARTVRWYRRKPVVAGLLTALILALVGGCAGILWQWQRAAHLATVAGDERNAAVAQARQAEANFAQARAAVDSMIQRGHELMRNPRTEKSGRQLLEGALGFYEGLLEVKGADPVLRRDAAWAGVITGDLQIRLGQWDKAEASIRRAVELYDGLVAELPNQTSHRVDLASALRHFGNILRRRGKDREAHDAYRRAARLYEDLVQEAPDNASWQMLHANTLMNWSVLTRWDGADPHLPDAEKLARQALSIQERLLLRSRNRTVLLDHALTLEELATTLRLQKRFVEAEEASRHSVKLREELRAAAPGNVEYRYDAARGHTNLALLLAAKGSLTEALQAWQQAVPLLDALVTEFPDRPEYRRHFGGVLTGMGLRYAELDQRSEAETHLRRSLELRRKLAAEATTEPQDPQDLVFSLSRLGHLLHGWGRTEAAAECYRSLVALRPISPIMHNQIAWFLLTCPDPAFRDPQKALMLAGQATKQAPGDADPWNTLALAHLESGDPGAALAPAEKARALRKEPAAFDLLIIARAHYRLGDLAQAEKCYDEAQRAMAAASPGDEILQRFAREVGNEVKGR